MVGQQLAIDGDVVRGQGLAFKRGSNAHLFTGYDYLWLDINLRGHDMWGDLSFKDVKTTESRIISIGALTLRGAVNADGTISGSFSGGVSVSILQTSTTSFLQESCRATFPWTIAPR